MFKEAELINPNPEQSDNDIELDDFEAKESTVDSIKQNTLPVRDIFADFKEHF